MLTLSGKLYNKEVNASYTLPDFALEIINDGGLLEHITKKFEVKIQSELLKYNIKRRYWRR